VNVLHAEDGTGTPASIFAALDALVTTDLWAPVWQQMRVVSVDVTKLDGSMATQTFSTGLSTTWDGNGTGDAIPAAAAIVKLQTALRGPAYRGRLFLPYVGEGAQSGGFVTTGTLTAWQNDWDDLLTAFSPHLVVASYVNATAEPVTAVVCEQALGTQRRRQDALR
jgi:hypothetical protein